MKITKKQRELLKQKYGGKCAYCGCGLPERWHADHFEAVDRKFIYKNGRAVPTGEMWKPENDTMENMMPSCPPCNIDKHAMKLEDWRGKLSRSVEVLTRNQPTYRHAVRFGLVQETPRPIVFYFEALGL